VPDGQGAKPGHACSAHVELLTRLRSKLFAKNEFFSKNVSDYQHADLASLKHCFAFNQRN
jgi:hypothetical protein